MKYKNKDEVEMDIGLKYEAIKNKTGYTKPGSQKK